MTISYANVDVSADNFGTWLQRTNQTLDALKTIVVTTDSNTTSGNSAISGTFTSTDLYTGTVYGGVFGNTSNLAINTNTAITGSLTINGVDVSTQFLRSDANSEHTATLTVNNVSFGSLVVSEDGADLEINGDKIWTANNDGDGSGLDADLLGGVTSNTFLRNDETVIVSGALNANGSIGAEGSALLSNGTIAYWGTLSAGGGYYKGNDGAVGDANNISNLFRVNANTLTSNVTFLAGENATAAGPITLVGDTTITIETGARLVIT